MEIPKNWIEAACCRFQARMRAIACFLLGHQWQDRQERYYTSDGDWNEEEWRECFRCHKKNSEV